MNVQFIQRVSVVAMLATSVLLPTTAAAQSTQTNWAANKWQFAATIYAYLPSIGGTTTFPVAEGGSSINIDADQILDSLKFTFMGSFDVHNGRWGAFTDLIYLDVGGSKSQTRDFRIGNVGLPASTSANLDLDLKGLVWTLAGEYRLVADPAWTLDVLAGARLLDLKETLNYSITGSLGPINPTFRSGTSEADASIWDAIIGVKGNYAFGANKEWRVPYYLDVGTGQSELTWQAAGGLAYAFHWGEVIGMWRYLDYKMDSGKKIEKVTFSGPMIGVTFRW